MRAWVWGRAVDEAAVIAALRQHWIDSWALRTEPYIWEDDSDAPSAEHWLRLTLRSARNLRPAIGRTREDNIGVVGVQVFGALDIGPGATERLASAVSAVWRAFRHAQIRLGPPSISGLPAEGGFNQQLVTVDWRADLRFNA